MEVDKRIEIDDEHSIEFGQSSWDDSERSVRRRKNNEDGKFSPHGSSEIPIDGHVNITQVFLECLKNDEIKSKQDLANIMDEIKMTAQRQKILVV